MAGAWGHWDQRGRRPTNPRALLYRGFVQKGGPDTASWCPSGPSPHLPGLSLPLCHLPPPLSCLGYSSGCQPERRGQRKAEEGGASESQTPAWVLPTRVKWMVCWDGSTCLPAVHNWQRCRVPSAPRQAGTSAVTCRRDSRREGFPTHTPVTKFLGGNTQVDSGKHLGKVLVPNLHCTIKLQIPWKRKHTNVSVHEI